MTAIISVIQERAVHLISDGIASGAGPGVQHPKVFPLPHVNALVGIRGGFGHFNILHSLAVAGLLFDDVARQLEGIARGFAQFAEPLLPPQHCRGFEVVLAGLSEDLGFKVYCVTCNPLDGEPPYQLWEMGPVAALPGNQGAQEAVMAAIGDPEACDVRTAGHVAMRAVHERAATIKPEWGNAWIGGFTQLTTLSIEVGRPVITTEILGRWELQGEMVA